jgi:WD40 repeat protein/RNase P subunit RPR2
MADNFSHDVFLSYNSKDKPRVRRLAERLKEAGLRVWFDDWNIGPGEIISLKVDQGLEQSRVLVLCISPNALSSGWVALERSTAIHRDPSNEGRRFIPLLLTDADLPDTLRRYKYVDFRKDTELAFAELLKACKPETAEPPLAPSSTTKKQPIHPKRKRKTSKPQQPLVLKKRLKGHTDWVTSVAFSPDGKWLASGSDDKKIKIWDLATGDCLRELPGHWGEIYTVAVTPDGRRILSGSTDTTVRVWDVESGRELMKLEGHTSDIWSVVALKGSQRAVSGGFDRTIRIWDLTSGECVKTLRCGALKEDDIFCCTVDVNETQVLTGHRDGSLRFWDLETGAHKADLTGHMNTVYSVKILRNGPMAISGSDDGTIRFWDLDAGTCVGTLEGHQGGVYAMDTSPNGTIIASAGYMDSNTRIWDLNSATCLQAIEYTGKGSPTAVGFDPTGSRLVVGTDEGPIYIYSLTSVRPLPPSEATHRYVNAKVVLIGESTVGKTTLAHRLIDDRYIKTDSTHGMNVWRLELPLPPDETFEREALLWDLAGQMDYREIHQLYLDQTALALLLINPQKDDPFAEAGDWIKTLKSAGAQHESPHEVRKLLITTRNDVGGFRISEQKIQRFLVDNDFHAWLSTSAKTGENCSDKGNKGQPSKLKQLIAESISWDKLPWTSTPRLLAEIKNAIMAMRDETDIRLVRFAELAQQMEQALPGEKFGESEVRTAVKLLANNGLVRSLKFGDLILLQPELLNGYAGAIIRAARTHTDEIGCVLEADVYKPQFDFTGVQRLKNRSDEELLLRAIVQSFLDHSLCIAEETPQGRQLVFPSQYRREKDIPRDPDIFVSYTFTGEWQTIWTTLVVRLWYSQEFQHNELWRNAAEFASPTGYTLGLKLDNRHGEGTATVSLYFDKEVTDDLKAIFIEYVHRHLARFGCEVTRDRRYVCNHCGTPVTDLNIVRKRLEAKKTFIICQECDERVVLIDFIEQRLKNDQVARKILAMDEIATRQLDTQALEQILIGHMMATCGEANQIFRPTAMFDNGIDGEVEFKDNNGKASGKKIYVQLKSGNSYLRDRKSDGSEVFDVKNERHLEYWTSQPVDVYLVIRQTDDVTDTQTIRWMNVTQYLKNRKDQENKQILFTGEKLDMEAVWKVRDQFFPKAQRRK